jgi:hypothetical protein
VIDARIVAAREEARVAPTPATRREALARLDAALDLRQREARRQEDLDELVEVNREIAALITPETSTLARRQHRLATLLGWRDDGNDGPDLAEAILWCEAAAVVGGLVAIRARVEHGKLLRLRFRRRWDRATLAEAIPHAERLCIDVARALDLPGAASARDGRQLVDELDRYVPEGSWVTGSFDARGADGRPFRLAQWVLKEVVSTYASLLRFRNRLDFDEQDLRDAIRIERVALRLIDRTPANASRAWLVTSVAQTMNYRARDGGADADLDESITELREVVAQDPMRSTTNRGRRSTLAGLLHIKASRTRDVASVSEAIELHRESLHQGTGVNPVYSIWQLQDLAGCYLLRHELSAHQSRTDLRFACEAAASAWEARRGEVTVGLLDTAVVYGRVLRQVRPDGRTLCGVLEQACDVLDRLEKRRSFGDREVLQSLGGRYGNLRDWLVEWHARRTVHAVEARDDAAMVRRVERTFKAIGNAKQRTLVAHMDVQELRAEGATATYLEEYRRIAESIPEPGDDRSGMEVDGGGEPVSSLRGGTLTGPASRKTELAQIESIYQRLAEVARQVAEGDADVAGAWGLVPPSTIDEVAKALPPGTTLVTFYPLDDVTVVIGIGAGNAAGPRHVRLAMAPVGREVLDGYASGLFRKPSGEPRVRPDHRAIDQVLEKVAQAILPTMALVVPGWARATTGPDREDVPGLILVPTGSLHRVPLHAMPLHAMPLGPVPSTGADRQRLVDRFVISYVTTADVLPRVTRRVAADRGVAAVAPCAIDDIGQTPHLTVAFAQALATRRSPATSLRIRHHATRDVITDGTLAGKRLVFVVAHGRAGRPGHSRRLGRSLSAMASTDPVDPGDGVRAGILMHDGTPGTHDGRWLSVGRIVGRAKISDVEHVQLLACETHADDPAPGDELSGLLSAFLVRGGRSVGGTLWKVDEIPAILVGWWLADELLGGATDKAAALRTATRRFRRATRGEVIAALTEIRDAAISSPARVDARALDALGRSIEMARAAPMAEITELWQLHHWSPYVLHGAPRVRGAP